MRHHIVQLTGDTDALLGDGTALGPGPRAAQLFGQVGQFHIAASRLAREVAEAADARWPKPQMMAA